MLFIASVISTLALVNFVPIDLDVIGSFNNLPLSAENQLAIGARINLIDSTLTDLELVPGIPLNVKEELYSRRFEICAQHLDLKDLRGVGIKTEIEIKRSIYCPNSTSEISP